MALVILHPCIAGMLTHIELDPLIQKNPLYRNALYALHQKYVMNSGGILINDEGRKLSRMTSPATPKEVNNNLDVQEDEGLEAQEIICEIAPKVTYAGEGLEQYVKGKKLKVPVVNVGPMSED